MNQLTDKQKQIYDFVKDEIRKKGYPPSVREICKAMELKSTSTVHMHLSAIERKGYIRRSPSKNRSIEILEENFYNNCSDFVNVPIVGKVTAGVPILAVENIEDYFPIPVDYIKNEEVFMLKIQGDSMIDAGINDKDLVLVKKQPSAINGDIIVALLDDSATVKAFYKEENYIKLMPRNPKYQPILAKDVTVLGKVIGLFRKF